MKVLQLISSSGYYGAEEVMVSLSQHMQQNGVRTIVAVLQDSESPKAEVGEIAEARGLPVEWVYCNGRIDRRAGLAIKDIIRREHIDVLHSHGYKAHTYGYFAARGMRCRTVATCHVTYTRASAMGWPNLTDIKMRGYREIDHAVLGRYDRVIAVSKEGAGRLKRAGLPKKKLGVIENGTNVDVFASASAAKDLSELKKDCLVGIVARLVHHKGHSQLFECAVDIIAKRPNTVFVVVGDGPLRQQLAQMAAELGISRNVMFTGTRFDMPQVYAALDVVVLPSQDEGSPMALIEAMAARRAVVASRVGGVPDIVGDRETGYLIDPGNPKQLFDAIFRVLIDAELRESLGQRGHEVVRQKYSAEQMACKYLMEYCQVTGHTSGGEAGVMAKSASA